MAGFLNRFGESSLFRSLAPGTRKLVNFGMDLDDRLVANSMAIGVIEGEFGHAFQDEDVLRSMRTQEFGQSKFIAFFDKDYLARRDSNRKFSMNSEIEFILDTIADEAIVYDDDNYFAYPDLTQLKNVLKDEKREEIEDAIYTEFRRIYGVGYGFNDHGKAWNLFRKFLIDGFLSFEIIYDEKAKGILGFKEIDPTTLQPDIETLPGGKTMKVWVQYPEDQTRRRVLPDTHVIYIAYAAGGQAFGRTAYVERLMRSFQLLRHMENARVIWTTMNAMFRTKMILPVGGKGEARAKQTIGMALAEHREDWQIDYDSGEVAVNGQAKLPFYKNYIFPANTKGEQTDIQVMGGEGPDLADMTPLLYFKQKLWTDSKIPFSRFQSTDGSTQSQFMLGPESVDREEIRFSRFISRLRSIFQEILYKPLTIQMMLKYPELQGDHNFRAALGVKFTRDNLFEQLKTFEVLKRGAEVVTTLIGLVEGEKAYFDLSFLIERYLGMTVEDLKENAKKKKETTKKAEEEGGEEGAAGDAAADAMGGGL